MMTPDAFSLIPSSALNPATPRAHSHSQQETSAGERVALSPSWGTTGALVVGVGLVKYTAS